MKRNIDTITEIDGAKILEYTTVNRRQFNNATNHYVDGEQRTEFSGLAICQYSGSEDVYLFYCDSDWNTISDTFHSDIVSAKRQASSEFSEIGDTWKKK